MFGESVVNYQIAGVVKTSYATLHMAGNISQAEFIIRKFCDRGACVQVAACDYIYTRGAEAGFTARFMNYPRFPREPYEVFNQAVELGQVLADELSQKSFSIETETETYYFTHVNKKFAK